MAEGATLCQLKCLINRSNVPAKPKQNVHASEEFFETVVIGHIIAAALDYFKMDTIEDNPISTHFSHIELDKDKEFARELFHIALADMVSSYINLTAFNKMEDDDKDQVRAYAREVLSLGVLLLEFNDNVHEGDGERLMRVWKFFMLIFRSVGKTKYTLEGLILLIQANFSLPPRLREQLLYSRFVNTRRSPGANISIDLHVEHVNKVVKSSVYSQMSNLSSTSVVRTSRCTGTLQCGGTI